jgi:hypothetical protein
MPTKSRDLTTIRNQTIVGHFQTNLRSSITV